MWFFKIMLACWISLSLLLPIGIVIAYYERDPLFLSITIVLSLSFYFLNGLLMALFKGWSLKEAST